MGSHPLSLFTFLGGVAVASALLMAGFTWNYYQDRPKQLNNSLQEIQQAGCILHAEIEKLKAQNRQAAQTDRRQFKRNLKLLGIKETKALDQAEAAAILVRLSENAPKPCPFHDPSP